MKRSTAKIRQNDTSDCGPAALASVAAYFGFEYTISCLRYLSGTDSSGTTIKGITDAAATIGLKASGYKGDYFSLTKIPKPAILHIHKENGILHYVVLDSVKNNKLQIMDPAKGCRNKWSREYLNSVWSGIVIVFPGNTRHNEEGILNVKKTGKFRQNRINLIQTTIRQQWKKFPLMLLVSLAQIAATLAVALFIRELLDVVIPEKNINTLKELSTLMLIIMGASVLLLFARSKLTLDLSAETDKIINKNYLHSLNHIPLPFIKSFKTGELTSRLSDTYRVRSTVSDTLPETATALITLVLSLMLLFSMNAPLAWICTIFIPVFIAIFLMHDRINKPLSESLMENGAMYQSSVIENVKSMESIRNFGMEKKALENCCNRLDNLIGTLRKTGKASIMAGVGAQSASRALTVSVLWAGSYLVIKEEATPGELISFYAITSMFTAPLMQLASSIPSFREGLTASSRIYDITSLKKYLHNWFSSGNQAEKTSGKGITTGILNRQTAFSVTDLCFGYPGQRALFTNLSFDAQFGKILHLSGENGSGKSTLVSLLAGHLSPVSGTITYNRMYIKDREQILSEISIVTQEPGLYGNSVMECILCDTREQYSGSKRQKIANVTDELDLQKIISGRKGAFNSYTGENGSFLSRGEQQRIAYARALIKEKKIVILDEVTSSLDTESKEIIIKSLIKLRNQGCAIVVISHSKEMAAISDTTIKI